jgi:hypothetical protein
MRWLPDFDSILLHPSGCGRRVAIGAGRVGWDVRNNLKKGTLLTTLCSCAICRQ